MAEAAKVAFGPNSPGFVILILVLMAVLSWMGEMLSSAIGKGQFAAMIRTAALLGAILSVVGVAFQLLSKFFSLATGKM